MDFTRRRVRALFLVGLLLGFAAAPVLGAVLDNSVSIDNGVSLHAPDGPRVEVQGATNVSLDHDWAQQNRLELITEAGNVTFVSQGGTEATINKSQITGTWTVVSGLTLGSNSLHIDPEDKQAINVSGDVDRVEFRGNMHLDDGQADFIYAGDSGTTTITVRGLAENTTVRAVDQTGTTVGVGTTNSEGVVTIPGMPNSEHTVLLQSGAASPILDNPQPEGNISDEPTAFSVYVDDDDFPGDTVNLTWYYNGQQFDTTTGIDSAGRYNTTNLPAIGDGTQEWSVKATDSVGNTAWLNTTFGTPGVIFIRNETNPSQLVTNPVNVTVKFENGSVVTTRTTSDGTLDMDGLPTTDFIVVIEASQNFTSRTVYFQSIIGNRSVYLLNKTYPTVESRFTLSDPTGEYPTQSVLYIKRAINMSGENRYRTIYSDRFGVEGVTATLQEDVRYQIEIRSPDGDMQVLGPYRADVTETVTVEPGNPQIEVGEFTQGWAANAELTNRTLEVRYSDPQHLTTKVKVWIHEKGNTSNRLRPNATYYDLGNFSATYTLTKNESKKEWAVKFIITRDDQEFTTVEYAANNAALVFPDLDREWRLIGGIGMMFMFAGAFSVLNRSVGGIAIGVTGGLLWWAGWLTGATTGAAIVLYLFIAIVYSVYSSGGP